MSGAATFSGTNYQASVLALVYVHILKQAPLRWFDHFIDTPAAVSGETDGPGDDARIEFGERHAPVEVQAKHGLTGGAKLLETVIDIGKRSVAEDRTKVVLVVDRSSSRSVHEEFALDLDRNRAGRFDRFRADMARIRTALGDGAALLHRIYVSKADVDHEADAERKFAIHLLEDALVDPAHASAAWDVLAQDAAGLCANRLRRTRADIVDLLTAKSMTVRPPREDEAIMQQLDVSRRMLLADKGSLSFSFLGMVEADAKGKTLSPKVWYRLHQQRSAALLLLHRGTEAMASARLALDIDPDGVHALLTSGHACVEIGDLEAASGFLERALRAAPDNPDVWAAKVQIDAMRGVDAASPPTAVASSESYRYALAQIAMNSGEWSVAIGIVRPVLACGKRDPKILLLLASALAAVGEREDLEAHLLEAEGLLTEALSDDGDDHPLALRLLVLRAELRRLRGATEESEGDLQRARVLNDRDPDALVRLAQAQLHADRAEYALQTLSTKDADERPMLLVVRAQARQRLRDTAGARADLDAAISRAADATDPDAFRLIASETALDMKDVNLAEELLDAINGEVLAPEMRDVLRGRIAYERRDAEALARAFRNAASRAPGAKKRLFLELGQRLLRLKAMREAAAIFEEIGLEGLPLDLRGEYAEALVASNDLARAAKLVEDLTSSPEAPDWALHVAAEIAARQGNAKRAVDLLARVSARHPDDLGVAFELARRLLHMRQRDAAQHYIEALVAGASSLDVSQRMAVAHVLKEAGRRDEAISLGFAAYRSAAHDPALNRAFGSLLMLDPEPVQHSGSVTADTYVKLRSDAGEEREYVIYAEPPIDPRSNEMLLAQAEAAGYVGKRVGDVVVLHPGQWDECRWTVTEILPAIVYVFRDIMAEYEKRFEGEPFFVRMFKVSEEPSVTDFAPLLSTLHANRSRAETVFKVYREGVLPLGFAAGMLELGVANVMAGATTEELGPLAVEWFDAEGQDASRAVARAAREVVLTRSAIETLAELELLETVQGHLSFLAPNTLVEALEGELVEAQEKCTSGQRTIWSGETGLRADETPADHPSLVERVERARRLLEWTRANVRMEFRPLETIGAPDSPEEETRATIGEHSMDAVRLTEHLGTTMLADDLGLRRFIQKGGSGQTMSTVSLLPVLAERGVISSEERDRLLLRLVERRYVAITPTPSLLLAALHPGQPSIPLTRQAFALLGGPTLDLAAAATVVAEALREMSIAPLQVAALTRIVTLALDGLSGRWPAKLCAHSLARSAAARLSLMPGQLKEVQAAIAAYVKRTAS